MGLKLDVAIVGGGIVGIFLARLLAERGQRPVVFRLPDTAGPEADTLRNQAWLQSGLRYARRDRALAEKFRLAGRRMYEFLAIRPPEGRGVFQIHESEADDLQSDARGLNLEIRQLSSEEASRTLGPLHRASDVCFETPEAPFREADLMVEARAVAIAAGAQFREVSTPVKILAYPRTSPSHRLEIDGREVESHLTVLAAGAGNVPLLEALRSATRVDLRQTPLLVIPGPPIIRSPLLVDKPAAFSVVAHQPAPRTPTGCMVVGTEVHEDDIPYRRAADRSISAESRDDFLSRLPHSLNTLAQAGRFTAGWEPRPVIGGEVSAGVAPWISIPDDHPDVIAVFPGRATLGLYAAEMVLELLRPLLPKKPIAALPLLPGVEWSGHSGIHMHHEAHYDGLNDADRHGVAALYKRLS